MSFRNYKVYLIFYGEIKGNYAHSNIYSRNMAGVKNT